MAPALPAQFFDGFSKSFAAHAVFDRGSVEHRQTLMLCALSRFFKVFSTLRILADTMKVSSSDRRSSKSRSTKSIEFSSKHRTKIVEKSGLCPYLTKNASERASRILRDAPVARPCSQTVPRGRPGSAPGAPWSVPRASRSAPEASPNRPGTPQIVQDAPRIDFLSVLGSILGRPGGSGESPETSFSLVFHRSYCARGVTSMMLRAPLRP